LRRRQAAPALEQRGFPQSDGYPVIAPEEVDEAKALIRAFLDDPERLHAASRASGRTRSTRVEVEQRRKVLREIIEPMQPMTVRQVFYQATVVGLIEKVETGYDKVQRDLALMRKEGEIPYEWLVDNTRSPIKRLSHRGIGEALRETAEYYRKDFWVDAKSYVEVWIEKDALSGVIDPVTREFDVALMPARGYASLSFLHEAAEDISSCGKPTYIFHLGDFDPSGVDAGAKIEETLRELAPDVDIEFERLAVTPEQISALQLPTRPTKQSDSRARRFDSEVSVELDAIDPRTLRGLVRKALTRHLPARRLKILQAEEKQEREQIESLVLDLDLEDGL
jgi:hypothetical protein